MFSPSAAARDPSELNSEVTSSEVLVPSSSVRIDARKEVNLPFSTVELSTQLARGLIDFRVGKVRGLGLAKITRSS